MGASTFSAGPAAQAARSSVEPASAPWLSGDHGDNRGYSAVRPDGPVFHVHLPPESETRSNDDFSLTWTAHEAAAEGAPSFSFHSTSSTNIFSMLAREKNGRFFKS